MLACALELRDVVVDRVVADVLSVDSEGHEHHLHVDERAVLACATRHPVGAACLQRFAGHVPTLSTGLLVEDEVVDQTPDRLLRRVAEQPCRRRVPAGHALVGVHDDDGDRADVDERLEVLLLAADLRVRHRLVGDVDHDALNVCDAAVPVLHHPGVVAHPDRSSVRGDDPVFHRPPVVAAGEGGGCCANRVLAVIGVENGREERRIHPRVARVAEDRLDLRADVLRRRRLVGQIPVHSERQLLDELAVPPLGVLELGQPPARLGELRRRGRVCRHRRLGHDVERIQSRSLRQTRSSARHPTPFALDLVEAREHGVQIACGGGGLGLLAERRELSGPKRPAVALQRVRRTPGTGRVAGGCGAAQRLELGWSVLEELVDELGEEHRVVAHALAQLTEYGGVHCASELRHARTSGGEPNAFPAREVDPVTAPRQDRRKVAPTVLIADDDAISRKLLRRLLEQDGYAVQGGGRRNGGARAVRRGEHRSRAPRHRHARARRDLGSGAPQGDTRCRSRAGDHDLRRRRDGERRPLHRDRRRRLPSQAVQPRHPPREDQRRSRQEASPRPRAGTGPRRLQPVSPPTRRRRGARADGRRPPDRRRQHGRNRDVHRPARVHRVLGEPRARARDRRAQPLLRRDERHDPRARWNARGVPRRRLPRRVRRTDRGRGPRRPRTCNCPRHGRGATPTLQRLAALERIRRGCPYGCRAQQRAVHVRQRRLPPAARVHGARRHRQHGIAHRGPDEDPRAADPAVGNDACGAPPSSARSQPRRGGRGPRAPVGGGPLDGRGRDRRRSAMPAALPGSHAHRDRRTRTGPPSRAALFGKRGSASYACAAAITPPARARPPARPASPR